MALQNNFWEFDFFEKFFADIWKKSSSRLQKFKSEVSNVNPWFVKNSQRAKNGPKSRRIQNFKKLGTSRIVKTFCLSSETVFGIITWITWSKTAVQIKRFSVHFWTFEIYFLNQGLTLETSAFDFWRVLSYGWRTFFRKKHKFSKVILKSHILYKEKATGYEN